jgi:GTP-binding protein
MRFIDRVRVVVRAGNGGRGAVAWRREANVPQGGPAGGDGGRGGSVLLVADPSLSTLLDLKFRHEWHAADGKSGQSKNMNGRAGEDRIIRVPVGTVVYFDGIYGQDDSFGDEASDDETDALFDDDDGFDDDDEFEDQEDPLSDEPLGRPKMEQKPAPLPGFTEGDVIVDLLEPGQQVVIAKGGLGGRGNVHFCSSTNRAPDFAEPGTRGQSFWLRFELKLLADVGIVGFPNVGKSTLIRQISRATPEVADYPFTTLVPHLGVVSLSGERSMVVADVPGLIEGAAAGRGLGHEFLRHLERTRVLLHVLTFDHTPGRHPFRDLEVLEEELRQYGSMFEDRPRVVAFNKIDTPEARRLVRPLAAKLQARDIPLFPISAQTGEGVDALLEALWRRIKLSRDREMAKSS